MAPNEKNELEVKTFEFLSKTLDENNNCIDPEVFSELCVYATTLQKDRKKLTVEEKEWLDDFVSHLATARLAEESLMKSMLENLRMENERKDKLIAQSMINIPFRKEDGGQLKRNITFGHPNDQGSSHDYLNEDSDDNLPRSSTFIRRPLPSRPDHRHERTHASVVNSIGEAQKVKFNEIVLMPTVFDGDRDRALPFIEEYQAAASINSWSQATMVKYFPTYLSPAVRAWYVSICIPRLSLVSNWSEIRGLFLSYYIGPNLERALRDQFTKLRQGDQSISQFVPMAYRLVKQVFPTQSEEANLLDIQDKLNPSIRRYLIAHRFRNIEDFHDSCMRIEDYIKNSGSTARPNQSESRFSRQDAPPGQPKPLSKDELCTRCDRPHKTELCRARFKRDGTPLTSANAMIDEEAVEQEILQVEGLNNSEEPISCEEDAIKVDKEEFSMRQFCGPILVKNLQREVNLSIRSHCQSVASNLATRKPDVPIYAVTLNGHEVKAMFDTGAHRSLIETQLASKIGLTIEKGDCSLFTAASTLLTTKGFATADIKIHLGWVRKSAKIRLVVSDSLVWPLILGVDYLSLFRIDVSLGFPHRLSFRNERNGVVTCQPIILPPHSQNLCDLILEKERCPEEILIKPINFKIGVLVAYSVSSVNHNVTQCLVANTTRKPILIEAGTQIAGFEELVSDNSSMSGDSIHDLVASTRELVITDSNETVKIGFQLEESQVTELIELIKTHISAFSIKGELGETNVLEHDIELVEGAKPYVEPLRRRPQLHKEEIKKQVKEMLDKGVIETSNSPWASSYVIVKKKTGDLRVCIDFRRLNDVTKKTSYPLPNTDDCLEPLSGNIFYSQLDLASGFWQIPLSSRAKELTAFRTEDGLYQFRRMPFGLCNAPASFQRLVNSVFAGLKGLQLQIFIDDLCIATRSWPEHISMLRDVFKLLIKSNLKLKSSKCIFGSSSVTFLGHVVDEQGIRADPEKVKAIQKLPRPKSVDEIRRVHGLLNYYRRLVPNFAQLAEPFTKLLKKNAVFNWGPEQNEAFNKIKIALSSEPVLAHFNHHDPIALKTDASKIGLAGILMQRQGLEWRIIACCSRNTSNCEKNYGITDLEGLAIVYTIYKFRNYLLGIHFSIITDHCPLCILQLKTAKSPRLRRWAVLLSEFDFSVVYTKGS